MWEDQRITMAAEAKTEKLSDKGEADLQKKKKQKREY